MYKPKLIRITTVPQSLNGLLQGQLHFMNNFFEVIAISSPGDVLKEVEAKEKVRVLPVEMTRIISPFKDLWAVFRLYKILRTEKPTIVHTHTPKAGIVGMIAAKLAGVPHRLHTVAGMPLLIEKGFKRKILDLVEKITYACATKVYPNSLGLYHIIIENNYTVREKLKIIGNGSSNGIDTSHFQRNSVPNSRLLEIKNELGILPEDFVYLFVGRIVKDKGVNELISAFKKIHNSHNNTKLILVGPYERDLDPLEDATEFEIKNNKAIVETGFVQDVRPYFEIADVLTFPSYREGFPNVVMQAGAMGVNSIVSDINGCNEIIEDGVNGFIIPPQNTKELIEKMEFVFLNREVNSRMAATSREFICSNYERKSFWAELLTEYKLFV